MGNEWGNDPTVQSLACELRLLHDALQRWLAAWASFPERLGAVSAAVQTLAGDLHNHRSVRAARIEAAIRPLIDRWEDGSLLPEHLRDLPERVARLVEESRSDPDYRSAGSIYSLLHGRLENIVQLLAGGLAEVRRRAERCSRFLDRAPDGARSVVESRLEQVDRAAQAEDPELLVSAELSLAALIAEVPEQAFQTRSFPAPLRTCRCWLVLIVEDDPVWQTAILQAVQLAQLRLAPHYNIACEIIADRESAVARLKNLVLRPVVRKQEDEDPQCPLLALDLGIPASPAEMLAPSRDEGLEVLRYARQPAVNVPALIVTTAPNFLSDHAVAAGLGVTHYLLKGVDSDERILTALEEIITRRPQRTLRVLGETGRHVQIDGVEVTLEPHVFRTFSVITEAWPVAVTPEVAVDRLDERYGGYKNTGQPGQDIRTENLRRNWAEALRQKSTPIAAVAWFGSDRYNLWKALQPEISAAGIDPANAGEVAGYLSARYPTATHAAEDFDPRNIAKHVHEAREAITLAFNAAEKSIAPEEEVIATVRIGDDIGYRIVAQPIGDDERALSRAPRFRVLVAENDVEVWQKPITRLLTRYGYDWRAVSSVEEAIDLAGQFQPHLLCLDMHLPEDRLSFDQGPLDGVADGGLRVLKAVSTFLPDARAIALTDLADQDRLRVAAADLGVRVADFMPKCGRAEAPWEAAMLLAVFRVEQEIVRQAALPQPDIARLPYLHLWRSRVEQRYAEAFDQSWKLSALQFKLVWLLAQQANRPVPSYDVIEGIYGNPDEHDALKQLIKNFRIRLTVDCQVWFGIGPDEAKCAAESILANDARAGWVLNARVVIED